MLVFLGSVAMVVLAEMGDKTQLLAMAFATRFPAGSVMLGVFIATLFNHALAVALGTYLGASCNMDIVQAVAAGSFILFGLWTLRGDTLSGEEKRKLFLGPVITVAIAFFIAEMGDKTQLATVALAAKYHSPLETLLGTTTGMVISDTLGVYIGVVAGKGIPERFVKWISAMIFIIFGFAGLYSSLLHRFISLSWTVGFAGFSLLLIWITLKVKVR